MKKHRRMAVAVAAAMVAGLAPAVLHASAASADVPAPYFATSNLGSDPHIIPCSDGSTSGYCLYTSQDMGQQYAYPDANVYPMRDTRSYFSPNGHSNWVSKGVAFTESKLDAWAGRRTDCVASGTSKVAKSPDVAGNCRAYHLWAPSAIKDGSTYVLFVPDVSDTRDSGTTNVHNSSRIAVGTSTNPFSFTYQGTVDHSSGYMSDPDAAIDRTTGTRYLVWADGDNGNCGGFKSAKMNSDWRTIISGTTKTLTINGIGVLGDCGGKGRPYMEGASIYQDFLGLSGLGGWTLVFAAKPATTPAECNADNAASGTAQTDNEVIAWASASDAQGPYTYQGIIMCGSTSEWTNQATVGTVVANGVVKRIMIYHDSAKKVKERRLHAECLYYGAGHIAGVFRQAATADGGFDDCMASAGSGDHNYKALWGSDPQFPTKAPIMSVEDGVNDVIAKRYAVGGWERFSFEVVTGDEVLIRARSNGKLLCAINSTTALRPGCTSGASIGTHFIKESVDSRGHFRLKDKATGLYVSIAGNGRLYKSADSISTAATFAQLSPTGR